LPEANLRRPEGATEVNILLKRAKFKKIVIDINKWYQKLHKIFLGCPNSKILLKIN
jgi:hypothetical protein